MDVAVTGGSGFLGQHVVKALSAGGHKVRVLDLVAPADLGPDVLYRPEDLESIGSLRQNVAGCDIVMHLAAVSNTNVAFRDPVGCMEVNSLGTQNVYEACRLESVPRVVLAGSTLVSGAQVPRLKEKDSEDFVDEDSPFDVSLVKHPYVMSKIHIEMIARVYAEHYDVNSTVFRYGIQYGRNMAPGVVAHAFITRALAGETLTIHGDGEQWRQYTHVADIARAHAMIADADPTKTQIDGVFNICGADKVSINDMATIVCDLTGAKAEHVEARGDDIEVKPCSNRKARAILGWEPEVTLEKGLADAVEWYRRNG